MATVTTNGQFRPLIDGSDLTPAEKRELDWVDWPAVDAGTDSWVGFRYRGWVYSLSDFIWGAGVNDPRNPWEAAFAQSAFDAIVVILGPDDDVLVGHACW